MMTVPDLYLKPVAEKGYGVFTARDFDAGAVIEIAPVIFFGVEDAAKIDQTILYNYYFATGFLPKKDPARAGCLAMGMMSFCNHADKPNAVIDKQAGHDPVIFILRATEVIAAGTEICISYGKVWFDLARAE